MNNINTINFNIKCIEPNADSQAKQIMLFLLLRYLKVFHTYVPTKTLNIHYSVLRIKISIT